MKRRRHQQDPTPPLRTLPLAPLPAAMQTEAELYRTDRKAWIALAAPRLATRIPGMNDALLHHACAHAGVDYLRAVYVLLDAKDKRRLAAIMSRATPPGSPAQS